MRHQSVFGAKAARREERALRPWLAAVSIIAGSLALCSCAAIPDLGRAPQPVSAAALASAQSFAAPEADWPERDWWTAFGDAQLNSLMYEALAHSPTMAQAQARLDVALARTGSARAALLPTIAGNSTVDKEKLSYNSIFPRAAVPHGWNEIVQTDLDFSWELDFWGKNRSALKAAVSEAKATDADAAGAFSMLTTALADAYIHLGFLFDCHDVAAGVLRNRQEAARLAERRVAQGVDTQIAAEQAAAQVDAAKANLAEVSEQIGLARNGIAALLGAGPDRGLSIARPDFSTRRPFGLPARLNADLLGRKPEIVAARWRAEAAAKRIGVARAAFYPDINLVAFIGFQALGLGNLTKAGSDIGSIGPAIHLPIFEGGSLRAEYRTRRAEYDLAVAAYDEALTQALRETADAARSMAAHKERLAATDSELARNEKAYSLAKMRYDGGLADQHTVLAAEDALLHAKLADSAIRIRGYSLDVALVKALGGGFETNSTTVAEVKP